MGQEQTLGSLIEVFTALPDVSFVDVDHADDSDNNQLPVAVRQVIHDGSWYFYAANRSPWPVDIELNLIGVDENEIESLSLRSLEVLPNDSGPGYSIKIRIKPFELVGGVSDVGPQLASFDGQLPADVVRHLNRRVQEFKSKLKRSETPDPISVLGNPGFEDEVDGVLSQWKYGQPADAIVELDSQSAYEGERSLHIASSGNVVWVRSHVLDEPATGRLSVSVWLRSDEAGAAPPLRISIDGESKGEKVYVFGDIGRDADSPESKSVDTSWQRFVLHFNDLPADLTNLRVGFDLMGEGNVWIDNVQLYDRWLDSKEAQSVMQMLNLAGFHLQEEGNAERCLEILDSYWPQFVNEFYADSVDDDSETQNASNESTESVVK